MISVSDIADKCSRVYIFLGGCAVAPLSRRIKLLMVVTLVATASHASLGSEVTDQIKSLGLREYKTPLSTDHWMKAGESSFEYLVGKDGNRLVVHEIERRHGDIVKGKDAVEAERQRRISPAVLAKFLIAAAEIERPGSPKVAFEAGAITYIGTDAGEFGGALYALREGGNIEVLIPDNVVEMLEFHNELLVFTGLAHMGTSTGSVWRINSYRTDPRVERITLLPGTPSVVLVACRYFLDSMLIVTTDAIVELGTFTELELHVDTSDAFLGSLFPTSAVQIGAELVIGMRGGIAVFHLPVFGQSTSGPIRFFANPKK